MQASSLAHVRFACRAISFNALLKSRKQVESGWLNRSARRPPFVDHLHRDTGPYSQRMANVVVVLYPDPTSGFPPAYARDSIPAVADYPDGQRVPSPSALDFKPGELVGCVSGALGLRDFLAAGGHELTSDVGQGRARLRTRTCLVGRRNCYLTTVLAGVPDRGTHREGAQAEAGDHRRNRFGSRRSRRRHRT